MSKKPYKPADSAFVSLHAKHLNKADYEIVTKLIDKMRIEAKNNKIGVRAAVTRILREWKQLTGQ